MGVVGLTLGEMTSLEKSRTIAIDFDGVIHAYSQGFQGLNNAYDVPHVGVHEALAELYELGYRMVVLTSRPAHVVRPWLQKNDLDHFIDAVTNVKIPAAYYIDDHALEFEKGSQTSWELALEKILKERKEVEN